MNTFELHFNAKAKKDAALDSFCYEPENIYEKRLGNLYMIGELKNVLPQNLKFLDRLAETIKEKYYTLSLGSPEKAFEECLKGANGFLSSLIKNENVSWQGNLNFAALSVKKDNLNFTKSGNIKILLLRDRKLTDIGENSEYQEISDPLKTFPSVIAGKTSQNDKIMVFTKEIYGFFLNENLIQKIADQEVIDKKNLKKILKDYEEKLRNVSGIFFLIQMNGEDRTKDSLVFTDADIPLPQKLKDKFSELEMPKMKMKIIPPNTASALKNIFKKGGFKKLPKIKIPSGISKILSQNPLKKLPVAKKKKKRKQAKRTKPRIIRSLENIFKIVLAKKNLISIVLLISILLIGSFIFQGEKRQEVRQSREILSEIETKIDQAENFLILKDEKKSNSLLMEAWQSVLPQTEANAPLRKDALSLQKSIEAKLYSLNKMKKNPEAALVFEIKPETAGFIPRKITFFNSSLYLFNPLSENFYKFDLDKKSGEPLKTEDNIKFAFPFENSLALFSKPNILAFSANEKILKSVFQLFSPDSKFIAAAPYGGSIYFLDDNSGDIIKYSVPLKNGKSWLNPKSKKITGGKSIAVGGSIWVLTKDNEIERYYRGFYKETLKLNFFPEIENPSKIWTNSLVPYLYILESAQNRIIILNKQGKIVEQFQWDESNSISDFTVSQDGKTIWLLNDSKIYQLKLSLNIDK